MISFTQKKFVQSEIFQIYIFWVGKLETSLKFFVVLLLDIIFDRIARPQPFFQHSHIVSNKMANAKMLDI